MMDKTCLAEGMVFPVDFSETGINANEIVVGPTRSGKTWSNAYSRLLHTYNSSVVIPVSKREIIDNFSGLFEERGYEIQVIDFANPEKSTAGFDPFEYIETDQDVVNLARKLVYANSEASRNTDPYWPESAISYLAAEMGIVRMYAKDKGEHVTFMDFIDMHNSKTINYKQDDFRSNLDTMFEEMEKKYPGNTPSIQWKTIKGLAVKTASCIVSFANVAVDKISSDQVRGIVTHKNRIRFDEIGEKKTAVFIVTSPMNPTLDVFTNIMYAFMIKGLFEKAQKNKNFRLKVPVHIICDDFACGKIEHFDKYISIFAAAGISVTLLIQSESQLSGIYGKEAATTIINNCDTYVYLGGMDIETCRQISLRTNKPLTSIMSMQLEQAIVFRRGMQYKQARRYQTMDDDIYKDMIRKQATKRRRRIKMAQNCKSKEQEVAMK